MAARTLLFLLVSLSLVGCRAGQLGLDQGNMRDTLLDLYEHQVVDNLIRARLHLPIIQVDYSNLTGTLTQAASGNVGGSETNVRNTPAAGAVGAFLRRVTTSVFNYAIGASQTAALTMTGQPVIANDRVYKVYLEAIQRDEDIVKKADGDLRKEDYHLLHKFNGELWYVPYEKREAFFKVYLDTTVFRQAKVAVELDVRTVIEMIDKIETVPEREGVYWLELILRDKIPNDSGEMVVPFNGAARRYRYRPVVDKETDQLIAPRGQLTDRVAVTYTEKGRPEKNEPPMPVGEFIKGIAGKGAIFRNDTYVAGYVPPMRNQLEEIRSQEELQRLQQFGR